MTANAVLLGLHAETSIHAGAGSALGVIDLPIQRESHTDYPVVFGSSIKGALRACAAQRKLPGLEALFGPEKAAANSAYAGALLVGDARLVALPVRSLTSQFRWVTCPYLVTRLCRDTARLGIALDDPGVTVEANAMLASRDEDVFLEEYRFRAQASEKVSAVAALLGRLTDVDIGEQLVVVSNDDFTHLSRAAIPVTPHVRLDSDTKTAASSALWYEESLPPETLFYVPVVTQASRTRDIALSSEQVAATFRSLFGANPYLQVGGNETVGMGWCKVKELA